MFNTNPASKQLDAHRRWLTRPLPVNHHGSPVLLSSNNREDRVLDDKVTRERPSIHSLSPIVFYDAKTYDGDPPSTWLKSIAQHKDALEQYPDGSLWSKPYGCSIVPVPFFMNKETEAQFFTNKALTDRFQNERVFIGCVGIQLIPGPLVYISMYKEVAQMILNATGIVCGTLDDMYYIMDRAMHICTFHSTSLYGWLRAPFDPLKQAFRSAKLANAINPDAANANANANANATNADAANTLQSTQDKNTSDELIDDMGDAAPAHNGVWKLDTPAGTVQVDIYKTQYVAEQRSIYWRMKTFGFSETAKKKIWFETSMKQLLVWNMDLWQDLFQISTSSAQASSSPLVHLQHLYDYTKLNACVHEGRWEDIVKYIQLHLKLLHRLTDKVCIQGAKLQYLNKKTHKQQWCTLNVDPNQPHLASIK